MDLQAAINSPFYRIRVSALMWLQNSIIESHLLIFTLKSVSSCYLISLPQNRPHSLTLSRRKMNFVSVKRSILDDNSYNKSVLLAHVVTNSQRLSNYFFKYSDRRFMNRTCEIVLPSTEAISFTLSGRCTTQSTANDIHASRFKIHSWNLKLFSIDF